MEKQIEKICRTMYKQLRNSGYTHSEALEEMSQKSHAIVTDRPYQQLVHDWIYEAAITN